VLVLSAGVTDSVGLAFGWTVFLLAVTERDGFAVASHLTAAALAGVALSGPVSARLTARLSPRDLLRGLAVAEGVCRVGVFGLFWLQAPVAVTALVVVLLNVLAWSAFAAMRTEVSRAQGTGDGSGAGGPAGRLLTLYAVAILASEALAAGGASLLLDSAPPTPVLVAVAAVYGLALAPQWVVGSFAPAARPAATGHRTDWRAVAAPCAIGGVVFLLASAPALLALVLAYEEYGTAGVVVSAVAFAGCSLGAARVQARVGLWPSTTTAACALGAVLVGGWSLAGLGLVGLAVAQGCAGVAQCALEGDLDARVVARTGAAASTSALALASSSRAVGGALAVWLLPHLLGLVSLAWLCGVVAAALAAAALCAHALRGRTPSPPGSPDALPRPRPAPAAESGSPTAVLPH
jgi:hypothetical protein